VSVRGVVLIEGSDDPSGATPEDETHGSCDDRAQGGVMNDEGMEDRAEYKAAQERKRAPRRGRRPYVLSHGYLVPMAEKDVESATRAARRATGGAWRQCRPRHREPTRRCSRRIKGATREGPPCPSPSLLTVPLGAAFPELLVP
jgi:hypothetical protein